MRSLKLQLCFRFCQKNKDKQKIILTGGIQSIALEKKLARQESLKQYHDNLPSEKLRTYYRDHLVDLTFYMNYESQKSQYLFAILNYQKIGFKKISDRQYLQDATYALGTRKLTQNQRWPALKFCEPTGVPKILIGFQEIYPFLGGKNLLRFKVEPALQMKYVEEYIDKNIAPALQSLFLHPRLTFEHTFHTDLKSYRRGGMDYMIVGIIRRNISLSISRVFKNLVKIYKNQDEFMASRQKLTQGLKQLTKLLNEKQFFGGDFPNHMDFYLYGLLKTKFNSNHFQYYVENSVNKELWSWMLNMGAKTQYDPQRVTVL